jgi:hypothetical protein
MIQRMGRKEESALKTRSFPEQKQKHESTRKEPDSLKGAFSSVLLLGAFIVASWFAVFGLFLGRG